MNHSIKAATDNPFFAQKVSNCDIWHVFAEQFGTANILPIAQYSEGVETRLPATVRGKVPSVFSPAGVIVGYKDWPSGRASDRDLEKWRNDGRYGFGIRLGYPLPGGGVAVCIDVDTENEEHQRTIYKILTAACGHVIPMRVRINSNRRAYVLAVDTEEEICKRVFKLEPENGKQAAVEILARGQQFVAFGKHHTGADIEWLDDVAISMTCSQYLPSMRRDMISADAFEKLLQAIQEALPVAETATSQARNRADKGAAVPADDVARYLDENGYTLFIGSEGQRHIRSPFEWEYTENQAANDTSVSYFLPGTRDYKNGHFVSHHASDAGRTDADFLEATGYAARLFDDLTEGEEQTAPAAVDAFEALPDDQPQAVAVTMAPAANDSDLKAPGETLKRIEGRAAFLNAKPGQAVQPFEQWKGYTGDTVQDTPRQEASEAKGMPLRYVPPQIMPTKFNKEGKCTAYKPVNHRDNFKWMVYRAGVMLARNMMTFEIEVFDTKTGQQKTHSEAKTYSFLVGQASKLGLPKDVIKDHLEAVAEDCSYHPVTRHLEGREWDGVERVQAVIDCVPVADDRKPLRDALLKGLFAAAILAVKKSSINMKYAPVLYSEANDFYKTSFFRRCFDLLPGAFKEGVSLDPTKKDSLRPAICCWFGEFGELDGMTKRESAPLKTFMGKDMDEWRPEHSKTYVRKPRQSVYGGSVNKNDFLKDPTAGSRLPVIELIAPIDIERVNGLLGWALEKGEPVKIDAEQLTQFWLEIAHMVEQGLTHQLAPDMLADMKANNERYVDKGVFYEAILDLLHGDLYQPGDRGGPVKNLVTDTLNDGKGLAWFTAKDMADALRAGSKEVRYIGRTLATMAKDGFLHTRRTKTGAMYQVILPMFQDPANDNPKRFNGAALSGEPTNENGIHKARTDFEDLTVSPAR